MDIRRFLIIVTFGTFPAIAGAQQVTEIYKCTDAAGRPLYTSDKKETTGKNCVLVSREVNVVAPQKPAPAAVPRGASPGPRETPEARATARGRQRDILQAELQTEEALLAKARQALAEQEAIRSGNEKNYAKVEERLRPFQEAVELHQKNIAALKKELGTLSR
jgi:hypothetical protein